MSKTDVPFHNLPTPRIPPGWVGAGRSFFCNAVAVAIICVWLFPLLAALLDMACWFIVDHTCSPVKWNLDRFVVALMWMFLLFFPAMAMVESVSD